MYFSCPLQGCSEKEKEVGLPANGNTENGFSPDVKPHVDGDCIDNIDERQPMYPKENAVEGTAEEKV